MAPGLPEQKFGTMWVMVLFRAIIWFILSPNSAFLAMRLPTALSCRPKSLELDDLHILSKQLIDDLTAINLLFDRQLLHEVSYFAIEIDRQIEFAVRVVEFTSYAF